MEYCLLDTGRSILTAWRLYAVIPDPRLKAQNQEKRGMKDSDNLSVRISWNIF